MQLPKKQVIEAAARGGSIREADHMIGAGYILAEIAAYFIYQATITAREAGLGLGEIGRLQGVYDRVLDQYNKAWREFIIKVGQQDCVYHDIATVLPAIARMLGVDQYAIDPETGKRVSDLPDNDSADAAVSATAISAQLDTTKPTKRAPYRRDNLSEGQWKALGKECSLTFKSHTALSHLFTCMAEEMGCTKRDLINDALISYLEAAEQASRKQRNMQSNGTKQQPSR